MTMTMTMSMSLSVLIRFLVYAILIDLNGKGVSECRSLTIRRHGRHGHHLELDQSVARESSLRHLSRENYDWSDKNENDLNGSGRRKRHGTVTYKRMTEDDRKEFLRFKQLKNAGRFDDYYEMEVKEAQNSSICNYTVVPIPDSRGSRITTDLDHVICNHVGSSCLSGTHCCIQTYRKVEVKYADNFKETIKVYAGCVCALQIIDELPDYEKTLPIND